jgi:toxin YoeB
LEIVYVKEALADIEYWKKSGNKIIQNKIKRLLNDIIANPFTGIGKPEPLQHQLSGLWSRRITQEHRLIYEVEENSITVYSLKGHYN